MGPRVSAHGESVPYTVGTFCFCYIADLLEPCMLNHQMTMLTLNFVPQMCEAGWYLPL